MSKLAQFPLEWTQQGEKDRNVVIFGIQGWNLTVGDVLDARATVASSGDTSPQHSVTEQANYDAPLDVFKHMAGTAETDMQQSLNRAQPLASTAATQPEQADERAGFEAYARKFWFLSSQTREYDLDRALDWSGDHYVDSDTQRMWQVWQRRATIS